MTTRLESEFLRDWRYWLAALTPPLRARYEALLAGRPRTREMQAAAIDVVMREPYIGGCCAMCAVKERR